MQANPGLQPRRSLAYLDFSKRGRSLSVAGELTAAEQLIDAAQRSEARTIFMPIPSASVGWFLFAGPADRDFLRLPKPDVKEPASNN